MNVELFMQIVMVNLLMVFTCFSVYLTLYTIKLIKEIFEDM
jgi:hypothetical protein